MIMNEGRGRLANYEMMSKKTDQGIQSRDYRFRRCRQLHVFQTTNHVKYLSPNERLRHRVRNASGRARIEFTVRVGSDHECRSPLQ